MFSWQFSLGNECWWPQEEGSSDTLSGFVYASWWGVKAARVISCVQHYVLFNVEIDIILLWITIGRGSPSSLPLYMESNSKYK